MSDCEHKWEEGISQTLGTVWICNLCEAFTQIDPISDCPECHGTRKTVINNIIGVEDCPICTDRDKLLAHEG